MRGKGNGAAIPQERMGITPAYAGKRRRTDLVFRSSGDHPRVCGEKSVSTVMVVNLMGSPPRMRGKEFFHRLRSAACGITPAYAGKSSSIVLNLKDQGDHPRVCGEKTTRTCKSSGSVGSPPRMRGKVNKFNEPLRRGGITPAYAGKSRTADGRRMQRKDHPRVCGEKHFTTGTSVNPRGSPPRMRGKVPDFLVFSLLLGITPAYAGKSPSYEAVYAVYRDHPRVCGEKLLGTM